jgi:hypothetical protein
MPDLDFHDGELKIANVDDVSRVFSDLDAIAYFKRVAPYDE